MTNADSTVYVVDDDAPVLKAIARYLRIDEDYFVDTVRDGNSVLRLLHYPPQPEPTGEHIRAGAHEDINTITLLLGAEEAGLELKTRDGRWIPVSPKPGELVIIAATSLGAWGAARGIGAR
jgi:isopenicillin N synthase-like dioxygenase